MRLRVCLVGFGYWGPNLARNIVGSDSFHLSFILEPDQKKHSRINQLYPTVRIIETINELLEVQDEIDVGFIATPTSTHFELAKTFLDLGCHVWIEKPYTNSVLEADMLNSIAKEKSLKIFVDHTYLYTSAISEIKSLSSKIGEITYINSTRANFGIIQNDSSVIWDLAVHDLSIINFLVGKNPLSVIATASSPFPGIQDSIATMVVNYENFSCNIHVNWLSPFKVRDLIIGGTSKSIHFDDTKTDDKVKIYSQSIEDLPNFNKENIRLYEYKYGEILIPDISNQEALGIAIKDFAIYINDGIEPPSSGFKAIEIIKILSAAEDSILRHGQLVKINCSLEEENE